MEPFIPGKTSAASPPEAELRLMAKLVEDAIECFLRHADAESVAGRREFRDAERWLFGKDDGWIFSFENVCSHLGVDPGFVRAQLRKRPAPLSG